MSSDSQAIVSKFFESPDKPRNNDDEEKSFEGEKTDDEASEKSHEQKETEENVESEERPHLKLLFSFLEDKIVNLTSAGYFAKIVNNLLNKRPTEVRLSLKLT